jgi:hypothetical protein
VHPPGAGDVVRGMVRTLGVWCNLLEPGPIAWKAIILPLDQECLMKIPGIMQSINHIFIILQELTCDAVEEEYLGDIWWGYLEG